MKIIFLSRLFSPHVGGVERHVYFLSQELINSGHAVHVLTEQYDSELKLKENIDGIQVYRLPYSILDKKLSTWQWVRQHASLIRSADIVHIHDIYWWYLLERFSNLDTPAYITFHGYEGSSEPNARKVVVRKIAERMTRGNICVGEFMTKWYHTQADYITYGAASIKKTNYKFIKNRAVYLGRLSTDAGIMEYLTFLRQIKLPLELDVYGDGPLLQKAICYVDEYKLPVKFHGFVNSAASHFQGSEYAFVSRYLGILEAMQSKRLVLAFYNNQIKKDYLSYHPQAKNMLIAKSAQEMAVKFVRLSPTAKMNMINRAYGWAKEQTWSRMADTYENLWQLNN
jgi:glycosyltransferase involved in cell wall biosynthesis